MIRNDQEQPDGVSLPNEEFESLLSYIKETRGFDFTGYKRSTLQRRVAKRMQSMGASNLDEYRALLDQSADEFVGLFNTILINVTSFMRDSFTWEYLRSELIPRILSVKTPSESIRIWSAGCASGEEAYSLAVLFAEACGMERFNDVVKIYATDVNDDALSTARRARYPKGSVWGSVPADLAGKYFEFMDGTAKVSEDIRQAVIFERNNLVQDPPISGIDLLACRNTLMYFNAPVQNRVLVNFHFALNQSGYLFLGKSEVPVTRLHQFKTVDLKRRIFAKGSGRYFTVVRAAGEAPGAIVLMDAEEGALA